MGAKKSKPLDTERVKQLATEVTNALAKEFPVAYRDCVWKELKAKRTGSKDAVMDELVRPEVLCQLQMAPPPTKIIKTGELLKKGAINTGWKKRQFTALNRADNYAVEYADDSNGSAKGRINCYGYKVEAFNEEEIVKHGYPGFLLIPNDEEQRTWYFHCENEAEQKEWMEVFNHACRNAQGSVQVNQMLIERQAFMKAFRKTRSSFGDYLLLDASVTSGSEEEMLKYFIVQILQREMLEDYLAVETSLHSTIASKKAIISSVYKSVEKIIDSIVSVGWQQQCLMSHTSAEQREEVEKNMNGNFNALLNAENALRGALVNQLDRIIRPVFEDALVKLNECLKCIGSPCLLSCEEAIGGFVVDFKDRLVRIEREQYDDAAMEAYFHEQSLLMSSHNSSTRRRSSSNRRSTFTGSFSITSSHSRRMSLQGTPTTPLAHQSSNVSVSSAGNSPISPSVSSVQHNSAFHNHAAGLAAIGEGDSSTSSEHVTNVRRALYYRYLLERELDTIDESVEKMSTGPLVKTQEILWSMFTVGLAGVGDILESGGVTPYGIYTRYMDTIRCLIRDAVYTFRDECTRISVLVTDPASAGEVPKPLTRTMEAVTSTAATETDPAPVTDTANSKGEYSLSPPSVSFAPNTTTDSPTSSTIHVEDLFNSIIIKLCEDAKIKLRKCTLDVLSDLIERTVQEMILVPAADILKQKAVIHKVPRDLRALLSVYYTGEYLIQNLISNFLDAVIADFVTTMNKKLSELGLMLTDTPLPDRTSISAAAASSPTKLAAASAVTGNS